ncbi:amidohydrolase family protein [Streptomyces sp. NPDC004629]|uniref:amidohydrolase family protein n=1 Tax=Streptomyces sp. NPDC004629 TaxID=3364705 RepID=UPI00369C57C6
MLHEAGVPLGSGADLIGTEQRTRARQICLMARLIGLPAAVESSTRHNARSPGIADRAGAIEPGEEAYLVVYEGDAATDPEIIGTARTAYVIQAGKLLRRP